MPAASRWVKMPSIRAGRSTCPASEWPGAEATAYSRRGRSAGALLPLAAAWGPAAAKTLPFISRSITEGRTSNAAGGGGAMKEKAADRPGRLSAALNTL